MEANRAEDEGEVGEVEGVETKEEEIMVEVEIIMVGDRTAEWLNNRNVLMYLDRNALQFRDRFQDRIALEEVSLFAVR